MPMLTILNIKVLSSNRVHDLSHSFEFHTREYPIQLNSLEKKHVNCYDFLVNIFCHVNIFVVKFNRLLLVDFHFNADRNFHTKTTTIKVSIYSKYADLHIYKYDLDILLLKLISLPAKCQNIKFLLISPMPYMKLIKLQFFKVLYIIFICLRRSYVNRL